MEDMKEGIEFAHQHHVKVYVTANILAHNKDLDGVREYFRELKEINLLDVIENEPVDVVKNYSLKQDIRKLYYLLGFVLTRREAEVLKLRFGLYGCDELTQREIAKRLNISRSYVSRIEKNAILKLRNAFFSS